MMRGDFWRRLRLPWLRREDVAAEVDDELAFHMEMRERELVEAGLDPEEARRRARADFGDVEATRRAYVSRRGRSLRRSRLRLWLGDLTQDLRFGVRSLGARAAFATAAVLVLALGIGAPTTVFTLVETLFFERPEHVEEPHRLLRVFRSWAPGEGGGALQHADYVHYRENATTLAGLAAYGGGGVASVRVGSGEPDQLQLQHVSDNYFDVLGVPMALGRTFVASENQVPGRDRVAVVSHGFWTRALGGDADAVGRGLTLNGIPFTVVGVAPQGFRGISPVEEAPDAWVPLAMFGVLNRIDEADTAWWEIHPSFRSRWLDVVGRVAEGVALSSAEANLQALSETLEDPHRDPQEGILVSRQFLYRPAQADTLADLSGVLLAAVGLVLLIAAANVAVLLLSRATTRYRELGIRTAMGAGRGRIVRQLVTESVLLGVVGGGLGIATAFLLSDAAGSFLPLPVPTTFVPEGTVLAAAAALTLLTSVAVGLAPALHSVRRDPGDMIGDRSRGPAGRSSQDALVVSQVALSLVLVTGAFLFVRSFHAASSEELGFDDESVLLTRVDLQGLGYDAARGRVFIREALDRLATLPSVQAVSTTNRVPFRGDWSTEFPAPEGATPNAPDNTVLVGLNAVGPDYFDVMDIDIVAGRAIGPQDGPGTSPAIVINETLAELLWPDGDPVGRTFPDLEDGPTVVGVARDATYYELGEEAWTQAYLPVLQRYEPVVNFLVETDGDDVTGLVEPVQGVLRELDPELAFGMTTTLESVVDDELARYEVSAVLVSLFGAIALALAAAGLYGVVSFTVSRRTRDIGVRMALGADRNVVARQILGGGLKLAGVGIVLGIAGAVLLGRFTEALLYGVRPSDPLPFVAACVSLLAVTAMACLLPARQATRVDPVEAIRTE